MGIVYAVRKIFNMLRVYKSPGLEAIYFYCSLDAFLFHKKHSSMHNRYTCIAH